MGRKEKYCFAKRLQICNSSSSSGKIQEARARPRPRTRAKINISSSTACSPLRKKSEAIIYKVFTSIFKLLCDVVWFVYASPYFQTFFTFIAWPLTSRISSFNTFEFTVWLVCRNYWSKVIKVFIEKKNSSAYTGPIHSSYHLTPKQDISHTLIDTLNTLLIYS